MKRLHKFLFVVMTMLMVTYLPLPGFASQTQAATPAKITTCKLISKKTVLVRASLPNPSTIQGSRCYLFSIPAIKTNLSAGIAPLASVPKATTMKFTAPVNKYSGKSNLYRKFVLAERTSGGSYRIISNGVLVSNPQKLAKYTYSFPKATSKKGLQVSASMQEDAIELNVQHSVLNINFATLISSRAERNTSASIAYKYHGKTYWFRRNVIADYDRQLKPLKETNCIVSAILLLSWRSDLQDLIYPGGRSAGHPYYAWNVNPGAGREQLQAAISFLANRYSPSNGNYGRIVNWIVGNEVNNYNVYNYAGNKTLSQYANIYAQAFLMTYQTVTSIYSNARVYISLDHLWNTTTVPGTFASRKMLDAFAKKVSSYGAIRWNLAYHPYSCPLTEPRFWANVNGQITESLTSPVINMGNLRLLTSYIKRKYGSGCRIILSEQGYTSAQAGRNVAKEQAAAIAYSYYLTEADDMVDSFIMNRHVDHDVEVQQGLNLGLWTTKNPNSPEWANEKKYSWNVFKYMDSNQSEKYTNFALEQIGISDWSQVIANFNPELYTKYHITNGTLKQQSYTKKASIPTSWKRYGAAAGISTSNGVYHVTRNGLRNRHCLWGFNQTFSTRLDFSANPLFCTTLTVSGATVSQAQVLIRIYSGRNVFECRKNIPVNQKITLTTNLGKWKYRKKVSKIQILVCPIAPAADWRNGAYMNMSATVMG